MTTAFDRRAFLERLSKTDTATLARLFADPTPEQESALRDDLGPDLYRAARDLAVQAGPVTARAIKSATCGDKGNVVLVPGFMASALSTLDPARAQSRVWFDYFALSQGRIERLRLADDGRASVAAGYNATPSGILLESYIKLRLSLFPNWNVREFWYDWRKDLRISADRLRAEVEDWFGAEPFHLVGHSTGGLLARLFSKRHHDRFASAPVGPRGGRVVMIGTQNHGSVHAIQALTGAAGVVEKLARLDIHHHKAAILEIVHSFPGLYQLLPSHLAKVPGIEDPSVLYRASTYGVVGVSQRHLDDAKALHEYLADAIDPERMVYIGGTGRPTPVGIVDARRLDEVGGFRYNTDGDGSTSLLLGRLHDRGGKRVALKEAIFGRGHWELPNAPEVCRAVEAALRSGDPAGPGRGVSPRAAAPLSCPEDETLLGGLDDPAARQSVLNAEKGDLDTLDDLMARIETRSEGVRPRDTMSAGGEPHEDERPAPEYLPDEAAVRVLLLHAAPAGVPTRDLEVDGGAEEPDPAVAASRKYPEPQITVTIVRGTIEKVHAAGLPANVPPIDALGVGHYLGEQPTGSELALDRAISPFVGGHDAGCQGDERLLLGMLARRGTIRGELGQVFLINDPRPQPSKRAGGGADQKAGGDRLIAVAGMGVAGRFGAPELVVLARELCFVVGRLGKKHLAVGSIGRRNDNLSNAEAVSSWINGVKYAITGVPRDECISHLTFLAGSRDEVDEVQDAITREQKRLQDRSRMKVEYVPPGPEVIVKTRRGAGTAPTGAGGGTEEASGRDEAPTMITVELDRDRGVYRFGAVARDAAIPEREIKIDPRLIDETGDQLVAARTPEEQRRLGWLLGQLLLPEDFRPTLENSAPLVLHLDAATARIPWEMLAVEELLGVSLTDPEAGIEVAREFLGTARGITRQLRTIFAPPPGPPPPSRRRIRALIVADPSKEHPLQGAEREGIEVAELFEDFNALYAETGNFIEVTRLLGPSEASRVNVLAELNDKSYDLLHFAGHCTYDVDAPENSGWIFSGDTRISARELKRIDRVPKFVFSNACESGITPDRSEKRNALLAPSFAESFFGQGVSNFICTAWPVRDDAALQFALTLYRNLLGVPAPEPAGKGDAPALLPSAMRIALREARRAICDGSYGSRTWGAYQHYGSPYFNLLDPTEFRKLHQSKEASAKGDAT